jgi:hypothetical protein
VSDLAQLGRVSIGVSEFGLSEAQSKRLRGESADEVRRDAAAMRAELGLEPIDTQREHQRDEHGRFRKANTMNALIRAASGRR